MEVVVLLLVVGGGVLAYRRFAAGPAGPDLAWSGAAPGAPTTAGAEPYRTDAVASPLRTGAVLSGIETRRLLASPLLWVGVALTALACLAALDSGIPDQAEWLTLSGRFIPFLILPLCGMVVVAANRAALRARRDGTLELVDSLPARPSSRTLAVLMALRGPALIGVLCTAALTVSIWFGAGKDGSDSLWARSDLGLPLSQVGIANIVSAIALVLCAGALGVGLARLLPWGLVPIGAVVLVGFVTGGLGNDELPVVVSGLGPVANGSDLPAFLSPIAQGWHVVYLVGLGALAATVAFLIDGDRRWGVRGLGVAAALLIAGIAGQSRTYVGTTADQIADHVTDPAGVQECVASDSARVCSFPELMAIAEAWLVVASDVRSAAPANAAAGPVEVHTRLSSEEIAQLAAPVRDELERRGDSFPWVRERGLHPDLRWGDDLNGRALLVGHELLGLPEPAAEPVIACYAGGQARAAVAIALAGRALPPGSDPYSPIPALDSEEPSRYGDPTVTDLAAEDWERDTEPAVVHSASDLAVGSALLAMPEEDVRALLADDWDRWIDPATPTADLAAAFGVQAGIAADAPEGLTACA